MLDRFRLMWKLWGVYDDAEGKAGMTGKSLLGSKVFWFNAVAGLAQVADWAAGIGWLKQPYAAAVTAIINVILRIVTTQPVTSILPATATTQALKP